MSRYLTVLCVIANIGFTLSLEGQVTNEGVSIKIVNIEDKKIPGSLNFKVIFEITNSTVEEVYVPNPRVETGIRFVQPEFFSAVIGGASCDEAGFVDMADLKKGSDAFTRIGPSETVQFAVNPMQLNLQPWCEFQSGATYTVQIMYRAQESFFDAGFLALAYADASDRDLMPDIYAKVLRGTVISQAVEFVAE